MKINKEAWHYKLWKKSFLEGQAPSETDLCRYCHKVAWQLLSIALIAVMCVAMLVMLSYVVFYQGLWQHPLITLAVVGAIGVVIGLIILYNNWLNGSRKPATDRGLVGNWMTARKQKVCPLIEFESDEDDSGW